MSKIRKHFKWLTARVIDLVGRNVGRFVGRFWRPKASDYVPKTTTSHCAIVISAERDHEKLAQSLMTLARKIQAAEERKRQLIDLYASQPMSTSMST